MDGEAARGQSGTDRAGCKSENPVAIAAAARSLISNYSDYCCIYTDASKTLQNVGIGVFFEETSGYRLDPISERLTDAISIYKAELFAICRAIQIAVGSGVQHRLVIFSDSLSSLMTIRNLSSHTPAHRFYLTSCN